MADTASSLTSRVSGSKLRREPQISIFRKAWGLTRQGSLRQLHHKHESSHSVMERDNLPMVMRLVSGL
jgi:hypothetical protein